MATEAAGPGGVRVRSRWQMAADGFTGEQVWVWELPSKRDVSFEPRRLEGLSRGSARWGAVT